MQRSLQSRPRARPTHVQSLEDRLQRVEVLLQTGRAREEDAGDGFSSSRSNKNRTVPDDDDIEFTLGLRAIEELEDLYFTVVHPSIPLLHRARYKKQERESQSPLYLQYVIWATAASASKTYSNQCKRLYQQARKHLRSEDSATRKRNIIPVAYAQAWIIMAMCEMKLGYYAKSCMSTGYAVRLIQMMNLQDIDRDHGVASPDSSPASYNWTEREEKRRVFWQVFCMDRYLCISEGLPTLIDDRDIRVHIPASEEAYQSSREERTVHLTEAIDLEKSHTLSPFTAMVVVCHLCASRVECLRRAGPHDFERYLCGDKWLRNKLFEEALEATFCVPSYLAVTVDNVDPQLLYINMGAACATICIQRIARNYVGTSNTTTTAKKFILESRKHCIEAASTISELLKLAIERNICSRLHPFTSFCLYNAMLTYAELWTIESVPKFALPMKFLMDFMNRSQSEDVIAGSLLHDFRIEYPFLDVGVDVFPSPEYSNTHTAGDAVGSRDSSNQSPPQQGILGLPTIPTYQSGSPFEYDAFVDTTTTSLNNISQLSSTEEVNFDAFGFDQPMLWHDQREETASFGSFQSLPGPGFDAGTNHPTRHN